MRIECFKDLECWKKARGLVSLIYRLTGHELFAKDFGLKDQIQRASVSVMANIAEGFGTNSDIDFIRYLSISVRSLYEVQSHLCVAFDIGYIEQSDFDKAELVANDCINLCKGLIRYLKKET